MSYDPNDPFKGTPLNELLEQFSSLKPLYDGIYANRKEHLDEVYGGTFLNKILDKKNERSFGAEVTLNTEQEFLLEKALEEMKDAGMATNTHRTVLLLMMMEDIEKKLMQGKNPGMKL